MGRSTLFAIVMAILCVFIATNTTMATTTTDGDCGQLIALPAAMESPTTLLATAVSPMDLMIVPDAAPALWVNRQEQKIYTEQRGSVNTASPPSNIHSSRMSMVLLDLDNGNSTAAVARTDVNWLAHPLLC